MHTRHMLDQPRTRIEASYIFLNDEQKHAPLFAGATEEYVSARPEAEDAGMSVEEVVGKDRVTHVVFGRSVLENMSRGEVHREAELMQAAVDVKVDAAIGQAGFARQFHAGQVLRWLSAESDLA